MDFTLAPTRLPAGIATAQNDLSIWRFFGEPDPTKYYGYFNDFNTYVAADWTVTETQAGATQALSAATAGGNLLLTNSAADDDQVSLQLLHPTFLLVPGKRTYFEVKAQVSDVLQSDFFFGLAVTDTSVIAGFTDGIGFKKDDGDANVDFLSLKDSAGSTKTAISTVSNATFFQLGFFYDGNNIFLAKDQQIVSKVSGAVVTDNELLRVTMTLQNGEAVAKTALVDYVFAAQER